MNEIKKQLKILVIEDDLDACNVFKHIIDKTPVFSLIDCTDSAFKALDIIRISSPDIIILDLELHKGEGNGIDVLNGLKEFNYHPFIIVTTYNSSSIIYEMVRSFNADYIMSKYENDYSEQKVIDFLCYYYEYLHKYPKKEHKNPSNSCENFLSKQIAVKISEEFNFIGIPHKFKGYNYLHRGVQLIVEGTEYPKIFAIISKEFGVSVGSEKRAMQLAIEKAWNTTSISVLAKHYTALNARDDITPTTKEFIHYYASKIQESFF